jgi:hypothetical protein
MAYGKFRVTARSHYNWQEMVGLNTYGRWPYLNHLHINFSKSLNHHSVSAFVMLQQFEGVKPGVYKFFTNLGVVSKLGAGRVTWSKFRTEDAQILRTAILNFVFQATWRLGFVYLWAELWWIWKVPSALDPSVHILRPLLFCSVIQFI